MQALAAAGFQAIAVDPPGIGDSDKPAGGYDTGSIGAALHAMMAQLGHERYQLVGHDIGMWIGYAMASDFPQAVERPVLTEAVIPGTAPPPPIFVAPEENIFLWHFMFNQLADLPETLTGGVSGSILAISSTAGPIGAIGWRRRCISLLTQRRAACAPDSTITGRSGDRAAKPPARRHAPDDAGVDGGAEHATGDAPLTTLRGNAHDLRAKRSPAAGISLPRSAMRNLLH